MKTFLACVLTSLLVAGAVVGVSTYAEAQGADSVQVDAGVAPAPAPVPDPAPAITAPDPIQHPKEAYDATRDAFRKGLPIGIAFALYLIFAAVSKRAKAGSWWDKGRLPTIAAAGASSALAILLALMHQTDWLAAMSAVMVALATALHSDPPRVAARLPLPGGA